MHGVKRTNVSSRTRHQQKLAEEETIRKYRLAVERCLQKKSLEEFSSEALDNTTDVLDYNPEYYSVWNFRRIILIRGMRPTCSSEEWLAILEHEIALTSSHLKTYPKVYWIWNHRKWCLQQIPDGPQETTTWKEKAWTRELRLVEKILEADSRNFHAWDYRRYVLASLPETLQSERRNHNELAYTTRKIEANFSNFSAWHHRTKLLKQVWETESEPVIKQMKEQEFDLVTQALWTDPADQSAWLYHRWLVGNGSDIITLKREIEQIQDLLGAEPRSKWSLDSLVHYSSLLLALGVEGDETKEIKASINGWLQRLVDIDPDRSERYLALSNTLNRAES